MLWRRYDGEPMTISEATIVGYMNMKDTDPPRREEELIVFSDLIRYQEPEFAFLDEGDLLLTLESDNDLPHDRFILKALYEVRETQETGDALEFEVRLLLAFDRDQAAQGTDGVILRDEMLAKLSWFPSPTSFFKPFPLSAWEWLREEKRLALPSLR